MPRAAPSSLDSHLGYQMRIVSNAVSQTFARAVEAEGVTVAEWAFLRALYDFAFLAPSELAERMGMSKGAITKLAHRLVEKGLVARTANADDRRAQTLALAGEGRALVPRLARLADDNDDAFFGGLGAADRAALDRILRRIVEIRGLKGVPAE